MEQLEPAEHFRVSRLKLMHFTQKPDECLDDFVNRCKLLARKCQFSKEELNERLMELIIASTPNADFQKELMEKEKNYGLDDAVKRGRLFEAAAQNTQQLQQMHHMPQP